MASICFLMRRQKSKNVCIHILTLADICRVYCGASAVCSMLYSHDSLRNPNYLLCFLLTEGQGHVIFSLEGDGTLLRNVYGHRPATIPVLMLWPKAWQWPLSPIVQMWLFSPHRHVGNICFVYRTTEPLLLHF